MILLALEKINVAYQLGFKNTNGSQNSNISTNLNGSNSLDGSSSFNALSDNEKRNKSGSTKRKRKSSGKNHFYESESIEIGIGMLDIQMYNIIYVLMHVTWCFVSYGRIPTVPYLHPFSLPIEWYNSSGTTTCFVSYRTIRMFHTPSQYAKPEVECTLL